MATTVSQPIDNLLRAAPEEERGLDQLRLQIDEIVRQRHIAQLVDPDGNTAEIPESAFRALKLVVQSMALGQTVTLLPHNKDLTTQEAADILHVSRPHLIKLLEQSAIPHHKVGAHRRVQTEDLLAYREQRGVARREKLDELTRLSEELPGGYR
jgi:excisionase family DNA binding protein